MNAELQPKTFEAYDQHTQQELHTKRGKRCGYIGRIYNIYLPSTKKGAPSRKCGKVEKRLTDHLARSHKIKRGSKRMKTMLARADAVIKETVVEPEKTILISESEEEIVMQPEIKTSKKPDLFYRNNAIRNFCDYLTETGISKADAIQCGAQAFFVWKRMDPDKTFRGLLDENALDRLFETVRVSVSTMIQVTITEEDEHSSNEPEQSDIQTDSDCDPVEQRNEPEQSDVQTVGHLDCDPAEQQQCSLPVLFEATPIKTENSGEDSNAEEESDANSDNFSNRRFSLVNRFKTWLMEFPYLACDRTSSQHVRQAMVIFKEVSPRMAVKTLLDRKAINECMTEHLDQMAPGSLLSSLGSLTRFLEFLIDTEVFRQEDMEPARRMIEHIKVLRKGMKKRVQQRRTVIQTEEIQTMIRPSDMAEFLNCPASLRSKKKALNLENGGGTSGLF
ncbi:unnamed protein product [Mytilus coruscus]|uniref:Uncharacterized protein n=1 Tax=Mytilus coruscus TaxID=42192 RepID=A0A6J8C0P2_MYTCO|nr:unnamed protein product [Mytilus coruscus]